MRIGLVIICMLLLGSCENRVSETATANAEQERQEAGLEHLVFFSLKDSLSGAEIRTFKELLKTLEIIEGVSEVEVNSRHDVGDHRALAYDVMMSIEFEAISYLNSYAEHPYHLKVRDSLKPYLAAPPATFDLIPD